MLGRSSLLAAVLLAAVVAPAPAVGQSMDAGQMVVRLQELQEELARLRGEVEELRHRQRQLEAALQDGGASAPRTVTPPAAVPPAAAPPPLGAPTTGTLGGGPAGPETARDVPDVPAGFERGIAFLQSGRWAEGRSELDAFVAANPNDPRAPEAAFWSADSLFVQGEYAAAASAFAANYRAFGAEAPFAPDSLLKVAMSLTELGDRDRACQTLGQLTQRHPDLGRSLEAAVARERANAGCN